MKAKIEMIRIQDRGLTRVIVNDTKCYDSKNDVETEKENIKKLLKALDEPELTN